MSSITKIKIGYFTDRFIEILSAAVQILLLQFLYYAFHRLSGYKTEWCFLSLVIREYRNDAYNTIRKFHGVFTFDDALDNAKAINESEDD